MLKSGRFLVHPVKIPLQLSFLRRGQNAYNFSNRCRFNENKLSGIDGFVLCEHGMDEQEVHIGLHAHRWQCDGTGGADWLGLSRRAALTTTYITFTIDCTYYYGY